MRVHTDNHTVGIRRESYNEGINMDRITLAGVQKHQKAPVGGTSAKNVSSREPGFYILDNIVDHAEVYNGLPNGCKVMVK